MIISESEIEDFALFEHFQFETRGGNTVFEWKLVGVKCPNRITLLRSPQSNKPVLKSETPKTWIYHVIWNRSSILLFASTSCVRVCECVTCLPHRWSNSSSFLTSSSKRLKSTEIASAILSGAQNEIPRYWNFIKYRILTLRAPAAKQPRVVWFVCAKHVVCVCLWMCDVFDAPLVKKGETANLHEKVKLLHETAWKDETKLDHLCACLWVCHVSEVRTRRTEGCAGVCFTLSCASWCARRMVCWRSHYCITGSSAVSLSERTQYWQRRKYFTSGSSFGEVHCFYVKECERTFAWFVSVKNESKSKKPVKITGAAV